jgi:hypothetical protein
VREQQAFTRTSRASARRWVTFAVVAGLFAAMAIHLSRTQEEVATISRLSIALLGVTCVLQFVSQAFLNGSLLLPLRQVTRLGFWELYLVRTGGFFASSLVPVAGGLAVRLSYLRGQGLTYVEFAWATLLSNVLALGAAALLALIATAVLWLTAGPPPTGVLGVLGGVITISAAAAAAFAYLPRLTRHPRLTKWRWLSDIGPLSESRSLAMRVFGYSLARHVLNFVTFGLLYQTLAGTPGAFVSGGLVYALTSPIRMVNVTPGNLGVTEWVVALVGKMVAFDVATGLLVSLAFRGVALLAQLLGAVFGLAWIRTKRKP